MSPVPVISRQFVRHGPECNSQHTGATRDSCAFLLAAVTGSSFSYSMPIRFATVGRMTCKRMLLIKSFHSYEDITNFIPIAITR